MRSGMLCEKLAETDVIIARKLAEKPTGLHRVTAVLVAMTAFGAAAAGATGAGPPEAGVTTSVAVTAPLTGLLLIH
jgi:hypothetical protein